MTVISTSSLNVSTTHSPFLPPATPTSMRFSPRSKVNLLFCLFLSLPFLPQNNYGVWVVLLKFSFLWFFLLGFRFLVLPIIIYLLFVLLVFYFANFKFGMNINSWNSQTMIVRKNWDLGLSFHVSYTYCGCDYLLCYVYLAIGIVIWRTIGLDLLVLVCNLFIYLRCCMCN